MDEEKKQEVQQWLIKSQHDLQAAQLLFKCRKSLLGSTDLDYYYG
jgi:hypothetical protein